MYLTNKDSDTTVYNLHSPFFSLHIQNRKDPRKIFFSDPSALFMKFPACAYEECSNSSGLYLNITLCNKIDKPLVFYILSNVT